MQSEAAIARGYVVIHRIRVGLGEKQIYFVFGLAEYKLSVKLDS